MSKEKSFEVLHNVIKIAKPIIVLIILGFLYLFFFQRFEIGIPCIFRKLTGYKCPGCGMTHAMVEIWNGRYETAMQYNALSLTVLPIACVYLFYRYIHCEIKKREGFYIWEYVLLIVLFATVLGYGYMRNQI